MAAHDVAAGVPWEALQYSIHVLDIPPHVSPWYTPCVDVGFQYSMEWYFKHFLEANTLFTTPVGQQADYVWVPQCAAVVYWRVRNETGIGHRGALDLVASEYLRPVTEWAAAHPLHQRLHGANFFTVLAMDLGRQDFPGGLEAAANWSVGSLTGRASWLQTSGLWPVRPGPPLEDACHGEDTRAVAALRDVRPQDFVIPIPSRFQLTTRGRTFERPRLLFFAGSINSCSRRTLHDLYKDFPPGEVLVTDQILGDADYKAAMLESKYCAVLRGSSHTNNVRLYDVIAHGCVPVVISDDFQPPLGGQLPWADMAVFLPPSELPRLAEILLAIPEERRWQLFDALVGGPHSAARALDWRSGTFWAHVLGDAARGMLAGQAGHAWRAAAEGHRAAALRRHGARRLDGPCAGVEDVLPAIAAVARSARPPVQGAVVVDADAGTGELAEGVLVGLGQLHRRRLRAASLDAGELEEAAAAECERPAEVATVVSLESSASSFRRLSLLAERQQWRLGGWAGVLGALAQEDGEAEGGQLVTLPTLQRQLFEGQDVLLLKFGPRGPQNGALAGAREALLAQKVGFVCFGYSQDAWGPRLQLQEIVRYLFSLSYACLLVAGAELFPMSGALWDDAYAQASRAAVVCAALGDDRLLQLASAFGGSAAAAAGLVLALRELYS